MREARLPNYVTDPDVLMLLGLLEPAASAEPPPMVSDQPGPASSTTSLLSIASAPPRVSSSPDRPETGSTQLTHERRGFIRSIFRKQKKPAPSPDRDVDEPTPDIVSMYPDSELRFSGYGHTARWTITNLTEQNVCFNVKINRPKHYRVH